MRVQQSSSLTSPTRPRAAFRRGRIALGLALAGAALAFAPSALAENGILGRDDIAFAKALSERGYYDMSKRMFESLAKQADLPEADRAAAQVALLDVSLDQARRVSDVFQRVEVLRQSLAARREFIAKNTGTDAATRAKAEVVGTAMMLGETLLAALAKETDAAKAAKMRSDGLEDLLGATKDVAEAVSELKPNRKDPEGGYRYATAVHDLNKLKYARAMLYAKEDPTRELAFESAIEAFAEYSIEFGDQLACYQGLTLQAMCEAELGRNDDAIDAFDSAIGVREGWEKDSAGKFLMPPEAINVVAFATLEKIRLLTKIGRAADAAETGQDFLASIPEEGSPEAYKSVWVAVIESLFAAGDVAGAQQSARDLIDRDPTGYYAMRGRELMAKAAFARPGSVSPAELLKLASSQAASAQYEEALKTCAHARAGIVNAGNGRDAVAALQLMGDIHLRMGNAYRAVAAYDAAVAGPVSGDIVPDTLWRACQVDLQLYGAEKKLFYRKRVDERLARLVRDYPKHEAASFQKLVEGKRLEAEGKYEEAAAAFVGVQPGNPSYEECVFRAGRCLMLLAQGFAKIDEMDKATAAFKRAEDQLRLAIKTANDSRGATLDERALKSLKGIVDDAHVALAQVFVSDGSKREEEALKLLDAAEDPNAQNADVSATVWRLRIKAYQTLGRLEDAEKALAALIKKAPNSPATAGAASLLARTFDQKADDMKKADPAANIKALVEKACKYYDAGIRPGLTNRALFNSTDAQAVIDRVFALALDLNEIPTESKTFLGTNPARLPAKQYLEMAASLYEGLLANLPSYRNEVRLARIRGYLGDYEGAAKVLAELFTNEQLVGDDGSITRGVLQQKPELLAAWVEFGAAERLVGVAKKDDELVTHSLYAFQSTFRSLNPEHEFWWRAKALQLRALMDLGKYDDADIGLRSVERTAADFDGNKYGLRADFLAMKEELAGKKTKK